MRQNQNSNKFNQVVANDLGEACKRYNDEEDDDKEVSEDLAQSLFFSVQRAVATNPDQHKVSIISINCKDEDRETVENVLK